VLERLDAGDGASEDERVDVRRALVGVDRLEVDGVTHHVVLVDDAVAAQHVARDASDVERLDARVALHERDHVGVHLAGVLEARNLQHGLLRQRDLRQHLGHLELHELVRRQRVAELLAVQGVLAGSRQAELGRADRAPADAEARRVEAGEGALQSLHLQLVGSGHRDVLHHDLAGVAGLQTQLALDQGSGQAGESLLQHEAVDLSLIVLGPDDEHVGDGSVGDPALGSIEDPASILLLARAGLHAAGVRAVIGLGQAEASDHLTGRQRGQPALLQLLRAELVDGRHHKGRLHGHGRAVGGVHALHLLGDESVAGRRHAGASVVLDGGAQQSELSHLAHDGLVEVSVAVGLRDARHQLALRVAVRGVAHHALLLRQLRLQVQRISPLELSEGTRRKATHGDGLRGDSRARTGGQGHAAGAEKAGAALHDGKRGGAELRHKLTPSYSLMLRICTNG